MSISPEVEAQSKASADKRKVERVFLLKHILCASMFLLFFLHEKAEVVHSSAKQSWSFRVSFPAHCAKKRKKGKKKADAAQLQEKTD